MRKVVGPADLIKAIRIKSATLTYDIEGGEGGEGVLPYTLVPVSLKPGDSAVVTLNFSFEIDGKLPRGFRYGLMGYPDLPVSLSVEETRKRAILVED